MKYYQNLLEKSVFQSSHNDTFKYLSSQDVFEKRWYTELVHYCLQS